MLEFRLKKILKKDRSTKDWIERARKGNRANARACIFDDRADYHAFEYVWCEAIARDAMRLG